MTAAAPLTCREMVLLTQAELDGELSPGEAVAVAQHRADCSECQAALQVIRAARSALRKDLTHHTMPATSRQQLVARLREAGSLPAEPPRPAKAPLPLLP
jgi:anti-sigma factor RsiW